MNLPVLSAIIRKKLPVWLNYGIIVYNKQHRHFKYQIFLSFWRFYMKNRKYGLLFLAVFAGAILFAVCHDSIDTPVKHPAADNPTPDNPLVESGYGRISVNVVGGGTGRTALPPVNVFDSYEYIFTKKGGESLPVKPDNEGFFTLLIGTYTVSVNAFISYEETSILAAAGESEEFEIVSGDRNDPVTVKLTPIAIEEKGKFTYTISYPAGVQPEITLEQWPDITPIKLKYTAVDEAGITGITETLTLDAGSYLFTVRVSENGRYAGLFESVHIYPFMTTRYNKVFTALDFIFPTYTVAFNLNDGSVDDNAVYTTKMVTWQDTIDALPIAPARTGYTFTGWNTEADGSGTAFDQTTPVLNNITVYAQWTVPPAVKSSNANIRAVSDGASGKANNPNGLYGLYIGGIPATNNGTPSTAGVINGTGTGAPVNGTIGGNSISTAAGSTVVVIVEDPSVSKVEFGRNGAANDNGTVTWINLTMTNDANTPSDLTNRRYTGALAQANDTTNYRFWVRITAEDGAATNIYRYTLTLGNTKSYGTLTSLSIGGKSLTGSALGTAAGWWNNTVSPSLAAGEVTLTSGDNVAIAASWSLGSTNSAYSYVIIPNTVTLPLKEGDFTGAYTSGNPTSISGLNNGDYILLRAQCTSGSAASVPIVGNALIKVNISSPPPSVPAYIGMTADVHWDKSSSSTKSGSQIFNTWMTKLGTHYDHLNYMLFGGDNGSAFTTGITHWNNIAEFLPIADSFVNSGFVGENVFVTGNHEWQNTAGAALLNNINNTITLSGSSYVTVKDVAKRLNYDKQGEFVRTDNFAIYLFGPVPDPYSTPSTNWQYYCLANRNSLTAYLATAPADIPIIIVTHFPLHCLTTQTRYTEYAGEIIDLLNDHPNVIFMWGHNHSNADPMYQSVKGPNYTMTTTAGTSTTQIKKTINFLYVPMGGMRDAEYPDTNGNSSKILNKGAVLKIDDKQLTFTYYDKECNVVSSPDYEAKVVYNLTPDGYVKQ
jgi:uncharacterized repeat protein (TIGR02543 family)